METPKIYMYDNSIGVDIPKSVDSYAVEVVLGTTVSEVLSRVEPCKLFCVFTPILDPDIIVPTKEDEELLSAVLNFGKYKFKIAVKESSIWYSDKAEKNIIFSNTVNLPSSELAAILRAYLNEVKLRKKEINKQKQKRIEMYIVMSTRRKNNVLLKTPDFKEAKSICDKNPCCVIVNRNLEEIYRSSFSVGPKQYSKSNHIKIYKSNFPNNFDVFRFSLR